MDNYEASDYCNFWKRFIGYDFMILKTGRLMTKGEFYRAFPTLCENINENKLPKNVELIPR